MELPDCPPGAEGYQDTVTEMPKKPEKDDNECTKVNINIEFFNVCTIINFKVNLWILNHCYKS